MANEKNYEDHKGNMFSSTELLDLHPKHQAEIIVLWCIKKYNILLGWQYGQVENVKFPDFRQQIDNEFGDCVGPAAIERATSEIYSRISQVTLTKENIPEVNKDIGLSSDRDAVADHDQIDARLERGARTSFGTSYERAVRRSTLAHAADLQALLAKPVAKPKHGSIGHNQPPSEITLEEGLGEQLKEAVETISYELNAELRNEQPDVHKVSRAARTIQSMGNWVAQKLDMTLDTFLKSLAKALGTSAAAAITAAGFLGYDPVVRKAMELYQSVVDWLNAVVLPM